MHAKALGCKGSHCATARTWRLQDDLAPLEAGARQAKPVRIPASAVRRCVSDTTRLIQRPRQEQLKPWLRQAVRAVGMQKSGDLVLQVRLPPRRSAAGTRG